MTSSQPQRPDRESYPPYDRNEINLMELLRVIRKWKALIIIGTAVCTAAAVLYSSLVPKVYLVDMMIAPAAIGIDDEGRLIYVDSAELISFRINQGTYDMPIMKDLHIDPKGGRLEVKADTGEIKAYERGERVKDSGIIRVTSEWEEKKVALGVDVLNRLTELLTKEYHAVVQQKKLRYDAEIQENRNKIREIEVHKKIVEKEIQVKIHDVQSRRNQIQINREKLEDVGQHIEKLLVELEQVKENAEVIAERHAKLSNKNNTQNDIPLMLYVATLQQNINYFHIYYLRREQREIESKIDLLERDINEALGDIDCLRLRKDEADEIRIDEARNEIQELQSKKELIRDMKVLKSPEVSAHSIKPKKKKIVVFTGLTSLFFFLFLSFFIEYMRSYIKK